MSLQDLSAPEEELRLRALRRYDILDTPPDGAFDRVTSLAARLFDVPIAIVSLVDRDRIWFKSKKGVNVDTIGRDPGLCASAILQNGPWLLKDASIDPRSMTNPLVVGELGLRFYLGVPLRTFDGYNLGTLCIIDQKPRDALAKEIDHLKDLADLVMDQMELRITARNAVSQREMLLHELHHRVKNNLQILLSIAGLEERRAKSQETLSFLRSLRGRLLAMNSAHDVMRNAESIGKGRTGNLLEHLSQVVGSALGDNVELVTEIEDHEVSTDALLPLALILNELMTNAYKHGLPDGGGRVQVRFRKLDGSHELVVRDNGRGLAGVEFSPTSTGVAFVTGLVRQLGGRLEMRNDGGTICAVTFPT